MTFLRNSELSYGANRWLSNALAPAGIMLLLGLMAGCKTAPERPALYPNAHLVQVGERQAQMDIDNCIARARQYGVDETKDGKIGRKATAGAIVGGVTAGAWGLVRGDAGGRAAAGAAAGAAGGAATGAIDSTQTSSSFKSFVQKCLLDRGYDVIGWQ